MSKWNTFSRGIIRENPVFVMMLGMCPTLGVTTSAVNGLGMGLATLAVLVMASSVISVVKSAIPDKVRIPCFIVIIASFVTIVDMVMAAYTPSLHEQLGLFIPLIVVNCVILGRAEGFASKNGLLTSIIDGLGMGLGFTLTLVLLGGVREILGGGTLFGYALLAGRVEPLLLFVMPPGAFIALGYLTALVVVLRRRKSA